MLLGIIGQSCIPNKKVVYMQPNKDNPIALDSIITINDNTYYIKNGDNLGIDIRSSDPDLTIIFQSQTSGSNANGGSSGGDINYLTGYLVDANGNIQLPYVGLIQVAGHTLMEAQKLITLEISKYITNPFVLVRLSGISFTTIGEFHTPGQKWLKQSKLTIFEAIANAGDLTILADRRHIVLLRKYSKGLMRHEIDLTDEGILLSPFYYIQSGDQIYAKPLPARQFGIGITGFQSVATVLSLISSGLILILTLNRL